jgi:hypothetical protein
VLEPCIVKTASCAVDGEEQVAVIAAHAGTAAGLGAEIGLGEASDEGVGNRVGVGVGLGAVLTIGDRDGLGRAAEVPEPQPASARSAPRANTPSLTGG